MTLSWSMDKVGPMCRTIEDCALVFHVIHGADEKDPSTLTAPFHFDRSPDLAHMNIGYTQGTDEAFLEKLRELGARPRQLPDRPSYRSVRDILNAESAAAFDAFLSNHLDERMVRKSRVEGFRKARSITALDYLNSQRRRFALMQQMAQFMDGLDMYVSSSGDVGLTNLTGHPAVVVPHKLENGQPQCITLIGDLFADGKILSVAHAYQRATAWHRQHPRVEDGSGN